MMDLTHEQRPADAIRAEDATRRRTGDAPVLLIGSGSRGWREYLLRAMSRSSEVWLFDSREVTWEAPYLVGSTRVDALDVEAALEAAAELDRRVGIAGVLSYDEFLVPTAAAVAASLGLPGGGVDAVQACRDKNLTRRAFADAGVPQPGSYAVRTYEEAAERAASLGYPVVVKPRALGGSIGVTLVADAEELPAAYAATRGAELFALPTLEDGVLVESFADGPEVSIDAACFEGTVHPLFVARKEVGFAPHFEEVGHVVSARDPLLEDPALLDVLQAAHTALGLSTLITHTEIKLTSQGPKVIEVNARLGGGLLPYIAGMATGIDCGAVAVALAKGAPPAIEGVRELTARIDFLYPETDLLLDALKVTEEGLPADVREIMPLVEPGAALRLPPRGHVSSRYAAVITVADTPDACAAASRAAEPHVEILGTPLTD
ncbi:ATP-grasp domain-containing protein [Streptomyces sp. NPDC051771]|uniref:ATP-grasp domain-containing protein n=1 Tax=Streptomyces sp. NPDC051771 TaxID=3154847 RepID=UPI00341F4600